VVLGKGPEIVRAGGADAGGAQTWSATNDCRHELPALIAALDDPNLDGIQRSACHKIRLQLRNGHEPYCCIVPISFVITSPTIADKMSVAVRKANEGLTSSLRSLLGKAAIHNLVVGAEFQDTLAQRGLLDAQEAAAPAIEAGTEVRRIISA